MLAADCAAHETHDAAVRVGGGGRKPKEIKRAKWICIVFSECTCESMQKRAKVFCYWCQSSL